jgi:hypothetical protein
MRTQCMLLTCAALIPGISLGQESPIDNAARIQFEINKAKADVDNNYQGKTERDLTREERIEKANAENEAANAVLEAHGMDAKSFTYLLAKLGKDEDPEMVKSGAADQEFSNKVKDEEKKNEEAKSKKPAEPAPIVVEKGPIVERGISPEDDLESVAP